MTTALFAPQSLCSRRRIAGIPASRFLAMAAMLAAGLFAAPGCESSPHAGPATGVPQVRDAVARIGVYDSRAVALAFGRSADFQHTIDDLRARHAKAVSDGDQDLARTLSEQGMSQQARLHLQVFSNAPADDAMEKVRPHLAQIASRTGVLAIVPAAEFHSPSVQIVDVTEEIVALFQPTEQTLKLVRECHDQKPMPIEVIAKMPDTH